jgi:hypothetical protein
MRLRTVSMLGFMLISTSCGSLPQVVYNSSQGWQQNQCQTLIDRVERDQCLRRSGMTYEEYKRQTDDNKR